MNNYNIFNQSFKGIQGISVYVHADNCCYQYVSTAIINLQINTFKCPVVLPSQLAKCEFGSMVFAINKSSGSYRAHVNLSAIRVVAVGDAPVIICRVIPHYAELLSYSSRCERRSLVSYVLLVSLLKCYSAANVTKSTSGPPDSPTYTRVNCMVF